MKLTLSTEVGASWTHKLARILVLPLADTPITPNHITTLRFLTGLLACALFAVGSREAVIWGGIVWVVSAFLDRADGELARVSGKTSAWGHAYDYWTDVAINSLLFAAIGIGLRDGVLGTPAIVIGTVTGASIAIASYLSEELEKLDKSGKKAYSGIAGFDFDDLLYLFGPFAWLDWFLPVLIGAAVCSPAMAGLTWWRFRQLRRNGARRPASS